jgi:hypothetical protein
MSPALTPILLALVAAAAVLALGGRTGARTLRSGLAALRARRATGGDRGPGVVEATRHELAEAADGDTVSVDELFAAAPRGDGYVSADEIVRLVPRPRRSHHHSGAAAR